MLSDPSAAPAKLPTSCCCRLQPPPKLPGKERSKIFLALWLWLTWRTTHRTKPQCSAYVCKCLCTHREREKQKGKKQAITVSTVIGLGRPQKWSPNVFLLSFSIRVASGDWKEGFVRSFFPFQSKILPLQIRLFFVPERAVTEWMLLVHKKKVRRPFSLIAAVPFAFASLLRLSLRLSGELIREET